jgi:hypothetical protein
MSLPTAAFLDTSVLAGQQYNFESTALKTFIPVAKSCSLKLLLPDPTEREVLRQIRDRSHEALAALDGARRKAPFLVKWRHYPRRNHSSWSDWEDKWELERIATDEWKAFLANFSLVRLGYGDTKIEKIMDWYDSTLPPFREGKKRKEFPDAFAIAILEAYARTNGAIVAVVSEDSDLKLACDRFHSLLYFRSLPALTELLIADPDRIETLRAAITQDLSAIETKIIEWAEVLDFFHVDRRYSIRKSKFSRARISGVHIVAIGDAECTLTFEAEIEADHLLEWSEYLYPDEDETEAWVFEPTPISGTVKVALIPTSHRIEKVALIEFDEMDFEVSEIPRQHV